MMRRLLVLPLALLVAARAGAQVKPPETCPTTLSAAGTKVCNAALGGVTMIHPTAALLLNGGNPHLGTAGAVGKFGRVALTVRAVTAMAVFPNMTYKGATDTVPVGRKVQYTAPHVDLEAGLLQKTMPMGRVGVDFILSGMFMPDGDRSFVAVPGSRRLLGATVSLDWGVRIGLDGPRVPSASLTIMRRSLPTLQVGGTDAPQTTAYRFNASAVDIRLFLGKRLGDFEVALGGGVDMLGGKSEVAFRDPINDSLIGPISPPLPKMRLIAALNAGWHVGALHFVGEGGFMVGSKMDLTAKFAENDTNAGKFFGSFGLVVTP